MTERWRPFPTKLPRTGTESRKQEDQRAADVPDKSGAAKPKEKLVQKKK